MKAALFLGAMTLAIRCAHAAPALCNNAGLQWAYYHDSFKTDSTEDDQDYDPTVLKKRTPVEHGTTNYLQYVVQAQTIGPPSPVYNNATKQPSSYFALNHRGYLFASQTGNYVFESVSADDLAYLWVGKPAYSGWDRNNRDLFDSYVYKYSVPGQGVYMAPLVAGNYYPIRIVFKQGAGDAVFQYTITDPSGNQLIGYDTSAAPNPYIVQYSCDGLIAPRYPPFGKEE